jgi:hypothetical protein
MPDASCNAFCAADPRLVTKILSQLLLKWASESGAVGLGAVRWPWLGALVFASALFSAVMSNTATAALAFEPGASLTDGVVLGGELAHRMRNNVAYPLDNTNMQGVDSQFNSWDLGLTPSNDDFSSVRTPPSRDRAMPTAACRPWSS